MHKGEIVLIVAGKKAEPTDAITFDQAVEQAVRWWRKALPSTLPPRRSPR